MSSGPSIKNPEKGPATDPAAVSAAPPQPTQSPLLQPPLPSQPPPPPPATVASASASMSAPPAQASELPAVSTSSAYALVEAADLRAADDMQLMLDNPNMSMAELNRHVLEQESAEGSSSRSLSSLHAFRPQLAPAQPVPQQPLAATNHPVVADTLVTKGKSCAGNDARSQHEERVDVMLANVIVNCGKEVAARNIPVPTTAQLQGATAQLSVGHWLWSLAGVIIRSFKAVASSLHTDDRSKFVCSLSVLDPVGLLPDFSPQSVATVVASLLDQSKDAAPWPPITEIFRAVLARADTAVVHPPFFIHRRQLQVHHGGRA